MGKFKLYLNLIQMNSINSFTINDDKGAPLISQRTNTDYVTPVFDESSIKGSNSCRNTLISKINLIE